MNEYIKTAQELAKLPGTEKWPWSIVSYEEDKPWVHGKDLVSLDDEKHGIAYIDGADRDGLEIFYHGPFLCIDDFAPWSAAKFLERAFDGLDVDLDERAKVLGHCSGWFSSGLDYNKAILAIGQRAWGLGEFAEWTLEQRKPWLDAWDRGQDVPT